MNFKKNSLILIILIIVLLQIFILINNKQKTSFRYFIWNIQEVTIGRLICLSFITGFIMSTIFNKTINNNIKTFSINEEYDKQTAKDDYLINDNYNNESYEMPPERDLRDTQPTISVNYRVVNDNGEKDFRDIKKKSNNTQYKDDWENKEIEW